MDDAERLLKEVFGYDGFRPLQREIMACSLSGRDVFALLPTGGGKSLCYQLPALVREGLTLVVSPLIALMKDQVDALRENGVEATFLNSSLDTSEARERIRDLRGGKTKLLYVAPERLLLPGFIDDLKEWQVAMVAVDEAHCISEWGHDFRPEYRRLSEVREALGQIPMMALTATATARVREDIIQRLALQDPGVFVAGFDRPNLLYRVTPKAGAFDTLLDFLGTRPSESGIIYCLARKTTESLANRLSDSGIPSVAYHAGMTSVERAGAQERFIRDDVRIVCATIAFGMGIDKPNVRFVVHYDLPKNIEGYYQETGRAGRDGLASECLLFYSRGDILKQKRFIEEKSDEAERENALAQLNHMADYAEAESCRRQILLGYFGETMESDTCGACDNCLAPREAVDVTTVSQKFLSCLVRIRRASNWSFGLNHVIAVLTGSQSAAVIGRGHDKLPTHGIGTELDADGWKRLAAELIRSGYAARSTDKFATVDITEKGLAALKQRSRISVKRLAETKARARKKTAEEFEFDNALFEKLRALRRELAAARDVPAYVIFSDVALRWMSRDYPTNRGEFGATPGVGRRKVAEFSEPFLAVIARHIAEDGRQVFS